MMGYMVSGSGVVYEVLFMVSEQKFSNKKEWLRGVRANYWLKHREGQNTFLDY